MPAPEGEAFREKPVRFRHVNRHKVFQAHKKHRSHHYLEAEWRRWQVWEYVEHTLRREEAPAEATGA